MAEKLGRIVQALLLITEKEYVMKQLQPIITDNPEEAAGDYGLGILKDGTENETVVRERHFKSVRAQEEDFSHLLLRGVRFSNCQFWNCTFSWLDFRT